MLQPCLSVRRPCGPQDAKGDQCDNCGTMLNPTELINPRCKITGTTPVLRRTKHLFLDLPKLTHELQAYINTTSQLGGWSANCVAVSHLAYSDNKPAFERQPSQMDSTRIEVPGTEMCCVMSTATLRARS